MLKLGLFIEDLKTGIITGTLHAINLPPVRLTFEPAITERQNRLYRAFCHFQQAKTEAGIASPQTAKTGLASRYLAVRLDSPGLPNTIYAKLVETVPQSRQYELWWDEPGSPLRAEQIDGQPGRNRPINRHGFGYSPTTDRTRR